MTGERAVLPVNTLGVVPATTVPAPEAEAGTGLTVKASAAVGVAVSAGAGYQSSALDPTRFTVYATPSKGATVPQVESAIEAAIAELADKGVSAEELERLRDSDRLTR